MADEAREEELTRTAGLRGALPIGSEEAEAMREEERLIRDAERPIEPVSKTMSKSVMKRLEIQGAIPAAAPEQVRRKMVERMRRWLTDVERVVDGENSIERSERLRLLHLELWPEEAPKGGCGCDGTGLVQRKGDRLDRHGRLRKDMRWVEPCLCQRPSAAATSPQGGDVLEDIF